jgi:hypothetical protein
MNDTGDMDALAAEYVLGTLESGERAQALALTTIDPGFVEKIRLWERRLSELHLMVEPIEPDAGIWERIKTKLPAGAEAEVAAVGPDNEAVTPEAAAETVPDEPTPSGVFDELPSPEAAPASAAPEPAVAAPAAMPAAPQLPSFLTPAAEAKPAPTPAAPVIPPPVIPPRATAGTETRASVRRGGGVSRMLATLLFLVLAAITGLVAAWRFVPDRVPPALQPAEVMRLLGVTIAGGGPPRPAAPPESRYDE